MRPLTSVLICGVSARSAADSAARAGYEVQAIDAFGDLDQHAGVRAKSLPRDCGVRFSAPAAARVAKDLRCEAVAYAAGFEHHQRAVRMLAAGRALLGNPPEVLRRVRDPLTVADVLRRRGFAVPEVRIESGVRTAAGSAAPPDAERQAESTGRGWLLKPIASGGGHRVRRWTAAGRDRRPTLPRGTYLQEFVPGTPGSVVFVAANGRAVPLGVSQLLAGDSAFGAAGYRYCGNILSLHGDTQAPWGAGLIERAEALAQTTAEEFGLAGVNGIDFVACGDVPYPIEVNPRWCASMELVERAGSPPLFRLHADACGAGILPGQRSAPSVPLDDSKSHDGPPRRTSRAIGKAVVFARGDVVMGDTRAWLSDCTVRDVPHPGERIRAGRPVCTIFAEGTGSVDCYDALVERANRLYDALAGWITG